MFRLENSERFEQVTAGVQNLIVTAAVVVGGLWTLYTFQALKTREKAKLDLELAEYRRAAIDVVIKANYVAQSSDDHSKTSHFIVATVELTNRGTIHADVRVGREPLIVRRMDDSPDGPREVELGAFQPIGLSAESAGAIIRPGVTAAYPYLIPVSGPGIYVLSFRAIADDHSTTAVREDAGKTQIGRVVWSADKIVVVPTRVVSATADSE